MDYTVHGILQARTPEWVEGGSNRPRAVGGGRRDSGDGHTAWMPLNWTLRDGQMVNVMLCMFYHNLSEKKRQASARWLRRHRGRQSQQGTGLPPEKAEHRGNPGLEGPGRG